jgi:hypothetical protein
MIQFWTVENTGWSNGQSWFRTGGTDANPLRFNTHKEALEYANNLKEDWNDPNTLFRIVHTTFERSHNTEVTTRIFNEL